MPRAPEALDAAFGLRGMGLDGGDAELLEDPAEVGRVLGPVQFFLQRPVRVVADEEIQAIAVDGQPRAVAREEDLKDCARRPIVITQIGAS